MDPHEEAKAKFAAKLEQVSEGFKEIAAHLKAYYDELKGAGFTDEEAFALVLNFQGLLFLKVNGDEDAEQG